MASSKMAVKDGVVQDGGPRWRRPRWRPEIASSKMAVQDDGPKWRRTGDALGFTRKVSNALDHGKVASRPRAWCRSTAIWGPH